MHKDDVLDLVRRADDMPMEELFKFYTEFVRITENTPGYIPAWIQGKQRGLHASMGVITEGAELLDEYKKHMYGKQRPFSVDGIIEELGDVLYYYTLMLDAFGLDFRSIIKDNTTKLANRYLEKFDV